MVYRDWRKAIVILSAFLLCVADVTFAWHCESVGGERTDPGCPSLVPVEDDTGPCAGVFSIAIKWCGTCVSDSQNESRACPSCEWVTRNCCYIGYPIIREDGVYCRTTDCGVSKGTGALLI